MREILFRGKRLDNGEWVEGFYVRLFEKKNGFYQANHYIFDGNIMLVEERYVGHGNYEQDVIICKRKIYEKTLGQFTGLTDKNGKRIFEGDILSLRNGIPRVVSFKYGAFVIENTSIHMRFVNKFEVIGNIHDNPELLENT